MSVPVWVAERAADFWEQAGGPGPFPRELGGPITRSLPLSVVYLPSLRLAAVVRWLSRRAIRCPLNEADRPLRACLVARGGLGFAFVEAEDDEAERRFSLGHELAHFLREYLGPRARAVRLVGERMLEVLDGLRPPSPAERLRGLLANVPVGFHTHLLAREAGQATGAVAAAERHADRLAYELLAPAGHVLATSGRRGDRAVVGRALRENYGLPAAQAGRYAELLLPGTPQVEGWLARLKKL